MKVLAIESSCDETALAVVASDQSGSLVVEHELIRTQIDLHKLYGGVVPELAAREHLQALPVLYAELNARTSLDDIDAIAVTAGPGLHGCLLMGVSFAEGIARTLEKPVIGVNHIEGHLLAAFLDNKELPLPFLALVVSGGHTEIVYVTAIGEYQILSRTRDDAAGEAFDKSAALLGFEYPGGAALARCADEIQGSRFELPRVMRQKEDFSFSGLKTAIRLLVQKENVTDATIKQEICFAVQAAITNTLVAKLCCHMEETGCTDIVVTGGVAANKALRRKISSLQNIRTYFPSFMHCTDNAAMIGAAAVLRELKGQARYSALPVTSSWPVESGRLQP